MLRTATFFAVLFFSNILYAQPPAKAQPPAERHSHPPTILIPTQPEINAPTAKEYESVLVGFERWTKNFNKPEFYKEFELKTGDKKPTRFTSLPKLDQDLFYIWSGQNCGNQMTSMFMKWQQDAAQLERMEKVESEEEQKKHISSAEVKKYIEKLAVLRKKHASNFEKSTEVIFKAHVKEIPQKDRDFYLKQIRGFHDHFKLVDRSKKPKEGQ